MSQLRLHWLVLPAVAFLVVGCIPTGSNQDGSCSTCSAEQMTSDTCPAGTCPSNGEEAACCDACSKKALASQFVELKSSTLDQLSGSIAASKGKIVAMAFWESSSAECKSGFARFVALQKQFADQGVVCLAVTLDSPSASGEAAKFLQEQKATFANYRIDAETAALQDRFMVSALPAVVLFDREGKQVDVVKNFEVEQQLKDLLARK